MTRKRRHPNPYIQEALDRIAALRDEYEPVLWAAYDAAEEATRGAMLNARGRAKGIDPVSLFRGNAAYANAYASDELREFWAEHPRPTFEKFMRQMYESAEDVTVCQY